MFHKTCNKYNVDLGLKQENKNMIDEHRTVLSCDSRSIIDFYGAIKYFGV